MEVGIYLRTLRKQLPKRRGVVVSDFDDLCFKKTHIELNLVYINAQHVTETITMVFAEK